MDLTAYYDKALEDNREFMKRAAGRKITDNDRDDPNKMTYRVDDHRWYQNISVWPHPRVKNMHLHDHDYFEIIYVHLGNCINIVDEKRIILKRGDLCLMNTQAVHTIELPEPDGTYIFNILVRPSIEEQVFFQAFGSNDLVERFFLASMKKRRSSDNYIVFHSTGTEDGYEWFVQRIVLEFYNQNMYREDMMLLMFEGLLLELARDYRTVVDRELKEELGAHKISEIVQYIDDHCCDVSVNAIAKQFNYHPKYVPNLIRKYSGSSFSEILTAARIRKAAMLLIRTDCSIGEIMQLVGYSNYSWFIEKFRKHYLMTPSAYRKMYKQ